MKTLVFGSLGQLGRALFATAPASATLTGLDYQDIDIAEADQVAAAMATYTPDLVINCAAYTAVDKAESEPDLARRINADAAGIVAASCAKSGARCVHISTDFIFDGTAHRPYAPDALPSPLSVYGVTKADGEAAVRTALPGALIVRTAWVYTAGGGNFVETMLRLLSGANADGAPVRVIADQVGTPTHAVSLARTIWALVAADATGTYHATDAGIASWYDFAVAIRDEALAIGLLDHRIEILPIRTEDYPTPATRPSYSVLEKSATWAITGVANHWRHELASMLAEKKRQISNG
jgi:dTDP-4-dehydrorhamnose reductase